MDFPPAQDVYTSYLIDYNKRGSHSSDKCHLVLFCLITDQGTSNPDSLNLWSIRDALLHAHQRGVVVRLVMESDNMDTSEVQDLLDAGIHIIGDQREGLMHDKFVVIDRSEVWTGSMNYTVTGAYKDNNNLLLIRSAQLTKNCFRIPVLEYFFAGSNLNDILRWTLKPRMLAP